ncbi:hydrolase [Allosaccharopolyspora coralli]|uniref:Hydrolase n=1 Tax=Allosaccharopolyspora coralli TaxID=2665642 RepID=A0A5Q3QF09_9PSEU|nr:hydrolase [Allosaccharopolyspora coralli]QGK69407.1 hydrolase [Allosaccharopolyspora coralli]
MTIWICGTCGVEHPESERPPSRNCLICTDERQWVPETGQWWTTLRELAAEPHELVHEEVDPGVHRLSRSPGFAIGQRTFLVQTPHGNLLWDPPNHLDEPLTTTVEQLGGASVIVASHPHMYGSQVSWSHHLGGVPVLVNARDREWVQRNDPVLHSTHGNCEILPGVTLVEVGGHFPGGMVAHVTHGEGTVLSGDMIMPVADAGWVTFMRSYPNQIPLSVGLVRQIVDRLEPFEFGRLHGLTGRSVHTDAKTSVRRSADRYVDWVSGANDHLG